MWRSLRRRIGALPAVGRLVSARLPKDIPGLPVLFDRAWYLAQNPELAGSRADPLRHFLEWGAFAGRDPNPLFVCAWYLACNPDVRAAGLNPLLHYARSGWREGRDPNVLFDTRRFLAAHPQVRESGLDPLAWYLTHWRTGGLSPAPVFRGRWYLERYPDVRDAGVEPLGHYLRIGAAEGRSPNPLFDGKWYLDANPDVAAIGENPLVHYLRHGAAEGRPANHLIKGRWYIDRVSDTGEEPTEPSWSLRSPAAPVSFGRGFDVLEAVADGAALDPALARAAGTVTQAAASQAFGAAVAEAAARGHHLLILADSVRPALADVRELISVFDADPMIGFVMPRLATEEGVLPLRQPLVVGETACYDGAIVAHLPALQLAPEFLSPCVIVRAQLVANVPNFFAYFETLHGALHATMTWSRRIGYRCAIANQVVVPIGQRGDAHIELPSKERATLIDFFPDAAVAERRFKGLSCHRREAWLASALSAASTERGRLLFDCSGMRPFHNGTSEFVLRLLDGLAQATPSCPVDIQVSDEAAAFHRMRERYATFEIDARHAGRMYLAAVRLSQPWTIEEIRSAHERALAVTFFIHDSISWDTIYSARHEVEQAWTFAAAHADALLYNSDFTMKRFNFRFPVAAHVHQAVTHLSFSFDEYRPAAVAAERRGSHILIIGNDHDHKAIDQALALLPSAFPAQQFTTIGSRKVAHPNVRSIRSGLAPSSEVDQLFAGARMIVYPSFYEGFGLPIVKALSCGLDIVARRSALLSEIAANCAPGGRIVPFDDPPSMIAAVGACLAGNAVETLPSGAALAGSAPVTWRDVATRIVDAAIRMGRNPRREVYDRREAALAAALRPSTAQSWLDRMAE